MSVGQMSVGQMSVDQMSIGQMVFDQKMQKCLKHRWPKNRNLKNKFEFKKNKKIVIKRNNNKISVEPICLPPCLLARPLPV
jgi:hypothetical protein